MCMEDDNEKTHPKCLFNVHNKIYIYIQKQQRAAVLKILEEG